MKLIVIIIIIVLITLLLLYKLSFDKENFVGYGYGTLTSDDGDEKQEPPAPYIPYIRFNNDKSRLFVEHSFS